jgi:hypothetical protein
MTSVFPRHNSLVGEVVYFAVPERFRTAEKLTGNLASPTSGNFGGVLFTHGLANGASGLHLDPLTVTGKSRGYLVVSADTNVFARQYAVQASITGGIAPRRELSRPRPASIATSFAPYQHRLALHLSSKSDVGGNAYFYACYLHLGDRSSVLLRRNREPHG